MTSTQDISRGTEHGAGQAGIEYGPRLARLYTEARSWIEDCFDDAPANLSDTEVRYAIERHYCGGWTGFVIDGQ
jgi:hypothetical protein